MASTVQLTGGNFQDALGNVLANGYLLIELNMDAQANSDSLVVANRTLKIKLDGTGVVLAGQSVWPNSALLPTGTFYKVSVYNSKGQLVAGPNYQTVGSSDPFDVGTWIPNVL